MGGVADPHSKLEGPHALNCCSNISSGNRLFRQSPVIQRKVLTPNDFASLEEVEQRLRFYEELSNQEPRPFEWKFDRVALQTFLKKLEAKRELVSSISVNYLLKALAECRGQPHS
jgi:hypothetical protein